MNDLSRTSLEQLLLERDHRTIDPGVFKNVVNMALKWSDHIVRQQMLWDLEKQVAPEAKPLLEMVKYEPGE
jgi:hypothetical protein